MSLIRARSSARLASDSLARSDSGASRTARKRSRIPVKMPSSWVRCESVRARSRSRRSRKARICAPGPLWPALPLVLAGGVGDGDLAAAVAVAAVAAVAVAAAAAPAAAAPAPLAEAPGVAAEAFGVEAAPAPEAAPELDPVPACIAARRASISALIDAKVFRCAGSSTSLTRRRRSLRSFSLSAARSS